MKLIEALIATGKSKVAATSQIKRLDEATRSGLEKKCEGKKLPTSFAREFATELAKADKRIRGKNKGISKKAPTTK